MSTKLKTLGSKLSLPESAIARATDIFSHCGDGLNKDDDHTWPICILYIAVQEDKGSCNDTIDKETKRYPVATVTQLLDVANTNILKFFSSMKEVKDLFPLETKTIQSLLRLERKYCIVSALYHKYEKIMHQLMKSDEQHQNFNQICDPGITNFDALLSEKKLTCWILFLSLKDKVQTELLVNFYLLLCCVDYAMKSVPGFLLQPPYDSAALEATANQNQHHFLQILCGQVNANYEEVMLLHRDVFQPAMSNLLIEGTINVSSLKKTYIDSYRLEGDIDETRFLDGDKHLLPTSGGNRSGSLSPCKSAATPVQMVLYTVRQLKNMLNHASDQPSEDLTTFFQNCTIDPTAGVKQRLGHLETVFLKHYTKVARNQEAQGKERYSLVVRLYYSVLQALLRSEEDRLSVSDFSAFLANETFHRALIACCTEVIMVTYGTTGNGNLSSVGSLETGEFAFPWVLKVFDLKPYNFCKVFECFIRDAPKITRNIVQHLKSIEDRILEELAWQADSPLFDAMKVSSGHSNSSPQSSPGEENSSSAVKLFLSPVGGEPSLVYQSSTNRSVVFPRSLTLFLNKVGKLAYRRLELFCGSLDITVDWQSKIWSCIDHVITCMPEMMKDRHLTQIVMCSIYAICKLSEREVLFKAMIHLCRTRLDVPEYVIKQVPITHGVKDSIIRFYNKVFMQEIKGVALRLAPSKQGTPSGPPKTPQPSSTYLVPGHKNFYVSQLKQSPFKGPHPPASPSVLRSPHQPVLTPLSSKLYCFGEGIGSAEKLQSINDSIRSANRQITGSSLLRSTKRLLFETDESPKDDNPDTAGPIKRLCPESALVSNTSHGDQNTEESFSNNRLLDDPNNQSWAIRKLVENLKSGVQAPSDTS